MIITSFEVNFLSDKNGAGDKLIKYFNTTDTSHVLRYFGTAGHRLKTPLIDRET